MCGMFLVQVVYVIWFVSVVLPTASYFALYALKPAQVQGGPGRHDEIHQSYHTKLSPLPIPTQTNSQD